MGSTVGKSSADTKSARALLSIKDRVVHLCREQGVERDGDDPGFHASPEDDGKLDQVEHQHRRPVLGPQSMPLVKRGHPVRLQR